uniref:Uncharacterized protein n=1 Tax=Oryza sativa subsp. japonica TaxID=39947 RepID=Q8H360_ORYSJ|nr:hypothetical protein [Oryza sativa Japonica Group]
MDLRWRSRCTSCHWRRRFRRGDDDAMRVRGSGGRRVGDGSGRRRGRGRGRGGARERAAARGEAGSAATGPRGGGIRHCRPCSAVG